MAWAEKLPNGRYRGVYRGARGEKRRVPGTYARKADAARDASAEERKQRRSPSPADAGKLTWGEWEPQWQASRIVAKSTDRSDQGRLRDHVRPQWESVAMRNITTDTIQRWVTDLTRDGMAPSTVAKCYYLLSSSMKAAHKAKVIDANPCKGVVLPKPGPMPERYLDDSEISAIKASLTEFDQLIVDVLLGTGMRLGEAMGLHWENVDLKRKTISVEWAFDPVEQEMKAPKDHERRVIPIGASLSQQLHRHLSHAGVGKPAPRPVRYPRSARVRSGLVLAHVQGRPFDPSNLRNRFDASVRIAHVGKGKHRHSIGHVRLHDLRHTYASRLLESGIQIEEVSRLLGHASITTTMRYAHRSRSQWDDVRTALG